MRESSSLKMIPFLSKKGAKIIIMTQQVKKKNLKRLKMSVFVTQLNLLVIHVI